MNPLRTFVTATLILAGAHSSTAHAAALALSATIPLPGVHGRIDHLAYDEAGQRLFVAALGNNTVEVVDVSSGRVGYSVRGLDEPQGVAFAPEINRLFIANGGDGTVRVYNAATYAELASISLGGDADNVRYDGTRHHVIIGYGDGGIAVLDATANRVLAQCELPVHPESFQLAAADQRIFINLPNAHEIAVLDRANNAIVTTWRMRAAAGNFPMALDESGHRLLIGCRSPARLVVISTIDGHEIGTAPLHGDTDDVFIDHKAKRAYASCGEGFIDVFDTSSSTINRIESVATTAGARTCFLSDEHLFLAVPKRGESPAEIRVFAIP